MPAAGRERHSHTLESVIIAWERKKKSPAVDQEQRAGTKKGKRCCSHGGAGHVLGNNERPGHAVYGTHIRLPGLYPPSKQPKHMLRLHRTVSSLERETALSHNAEESPLWPRADTLSMQRPSSTSGCVPLFQRIIKPQQGPFHSHSRRLGRTWRQGCNKKTPRALLWRREEEEKEETKRRGGRGCRVAGVSLMAFLLRIAPAAVLDCFSQSLGRVELLLEESEDQAPRLPLPPPPPPPPRGDKIFTLTFNSNGEVCRLVS